MSESYGEKAAEGVKRNPTDTFRVEFCLGPTENLNIVELK